MSSNYPQPSRDRGTVLGMALMGMALMFFLLVLIFISGGFFLYVILITAAIFAVSLLHWAVWGRALSQSVEGEREEELLRQRAEAEDEDWTPPRRDGIRRP
jgi:hypothetical protein